MNRSQVHLKFTERVNPTSTEVIDSYRQYKRTRRPSKTVASFVRAFTARTDSTIPKEKRSNAVNLFAGEF
jgi:hypothetical protein